MKKSPVKARTSLVLPCQITFKNGRSPFVSNFSPDDSENRLKDLRRSHHRAPLPRISQPTPSTKENEELRQSMDVFSRKCTLVESHCNDFNHFGQGTYSNDDDQDRQKVRFRYSKSY